MEPSPVNATVCSVKLVISPSADLKVSEELFGVELRRLVVFTPPSTVLSGEALLMLLDLCIVELLTRLGSSHRKSE